jgi:phosphatidylglycerophosphatase A
MQKNKKTLPHNIVQRVFSDWRYFIGFGFGTGLLPKMPGTWGSLFAIPFIFALSFLPFWLYVLLTVVYFLLGTYVSEVLSEELGMHDHGGVNCDEFLGMMVLFIPFSINFFNLTLGFLFFRCFDIIKPFPVGWIDKHIHGGIGMMLDDVAAAFLSMALLSIVHFWI